jgi:endonuclease YncB( thermonuclease family)
MQFLLAVAVSSLLDLQSRWPSIAGSTRSDPVLVRSVFDGDTIEVESVGRVRLLGIDAPEIAHGLATAAPFAQEAKVRLTALVWHRWVRLERDAESVDVYNRALAYVVTDDGQFVNAVLAREGLARVVAERPIRRLDELKQAEREAQMFRRGIWGALPAIQPSAPGYTGAPPVITTKRPRASARRPAKRARPKAAAKPKTIRPHP